ncbi:microtubule-associated protein 9 isoform X2 [Astyanax mexicanus]|uniref:microtubule-associated protein 9 isoform X2 n=1 Tax=Astyanax mexicanus TaxID=7994 RepID=UPI0020CAB2E9|nr:microtubule-associated protein 9 isoform X2 [Astyanax mexicanus]
MNPVILRSSGQMAEEPLRTTLAYTKSPKTSKRTTFQDELEAAVSARAKHTAAQKNTISYSDDFDDDDDDILNELLKTRRKKMDIFKTGQSKTKSNNFQLSDEEEEENVRPKKVSFLKSERRNFPVQDDQLDSARRSDTAGSSDSQRSLPEGGDHHTHSAPQSDLPADWKIQSESSSGRKSQSESLVSRKSLSESPLPLNSENSRWDSPAEGALYDSPQALSSERGDEDLLRALIGEDGEHPPPQPRERSARQRPLTGLVEDKPPRPRPRQRGAPVGSSGHDEGDGPAETPSSRAATSSVSIPLSFSDRNTTMSASSHRLGSSGSDGVQIAEEPYTASLMDDTLSSSPTKRTTEAVLSPLEGAVSSDLFLNQNTGDKYSTSSQENPQRGEDPTGLTVSRQSHRSDRSQDRPSSSRPLSSRKSRSACSSYSAQSRYLGSLKVLDQKSVPQLQPDTADSLRAAVYQEWLKKKEEKLQEALKLKKQEEKLKVEKKVEEEMSKKAEAKASYEAWKEKKQETLREKVREKQEVLKKQQKEQEEKEEKKETAKRVFEKWKQEHEERLQEQHLKQTQQKNRLKDRKEREQEERRRDCGSSFSLWSEKKKDALQEKLKEEREKEKIKEIEEKYQKEEREKTALEMYEKWLKRKEFQQKREKQEKKIKAIVQDEPPPPWSPPNRTVPFGK